MNQGTCQPPKTKRYKAKFAPRQSAIRHDPQIADPMADMIPISKYVKWRLNACQCRGMLMTPKGMQKSSSPRQHAEFEKCQGRVGKWVNDSRVTVSLLNTRVLIDLSGTQIQFQQTRGGHVVLQYKVTRGKMHFHLVSVKM